MKIQSLIPSYLIKKCFYASKQNLEQKNMGVIFVDIVGASKLINRSTEADCTNLRKITELFSTFDNLIRPFGGRRIKTNGDQYIAIVCLAKVRKQRLYDSLFSKTKMTLSAIKRKSCKAQAQREKDTLPVFHLVQRDSDHLAFMTFMACSQILKYSEFDIRVGASLGMVTIGIFDSKYPHLDIWGYPVLLAARLEAIANKNELAIDHTLFNQLCVDPKKFNVSCRFLKGIGNTVVFTRLFIDMEKTQLT